MTNPGWLSTVDPGWSVKCGKALFSERKEKSTDSDVHLTPSQHLGVLPQTEYMERTGSRVVLNLTGADQMKHVEADDFVIHLRSFQGGIEHSRYSGKVSNAYTILIPSAECEPRFFRWVLKSFGFIQELNSLTDQLRDGQSIKYSQFGEVDLPLPPIEEQRRIADFLDDQVGRIDQAIQLRTDRLDLEKERSGAFIARAFSVHSVDEARLVQLLVGGVKDGPHETPEFLSNGIPFLSVDNIRDDRIDWAVSRFISEEAHREYSKKCAPQLGDVLLTKAASVGKVAVVDRSKAFNIWSPIAVLRPNRDLIDAQYLAWALRSSYVQEQMRRKFTNSTQNNLAMGDISSLRVPIRSLEEQDRVVTELAARHAEIADSTALGNLQISLLQERKRSLISAAVTGQLDVTSARPLTGPWVSSELNASVESPVQAAGVAL